MYQNEQIEIQSKMLEEAEKVILDLTNKVYNRLDMENKDFIEKMETLVHMLPEDMPLPEPFLSYKKLKFNKVILRDRLQMFDTNDIHEDYKKIQF